MFKLPGQKPKLVMGSAEANETTRRALASLGDDGVAVRSVRHFAYPGPKADKRQRRDMLDELKLKGFDVRDAAVDNGLVLEHKSAVTAAFDQQTGELAAWFKARGWTYDGWECAVTSRAAV